MKLASPRAIKSLVFIDKPAGFSVAQGPFSLRRIFQQQLRQNLETLHSLGPAFPHLCLHLLELELPGFQKFSSFEPLFMKRLGLLKDFSLISALSAMDRRQRLFRFLPQKTADLCLMRTADLRVDLRKKYLSVQWRASSPPLKTDQERWNFVSQVLKRPLQFSIEISNGRRV